MEACAVSRPRPVKRLRHLRSHAQSALPGRAPALWRRRFTCCECFWSSYPGASRPDQPATVPQAGGLTSNTVCSGGQARPESAARRAIRSQRMVPRPSHHIVFDSNYYSVPYNLVHELVEVRTTPTTIEVFHKVQRMASHLRAHGHGHAVTISEHRPRSHQAHLEWTPSRMVHWAQTIGPQTARLFERILVDKPYPEMGYRSCLGIIRLADQYPPARMEAAAERAVLTGACRYQSVKSILKNSLDAIPPAAPPPSSPPPPHDNIRGCRVLRVRRRRC